MKLLIITYKYSPSADPRAFRWTAIAEYWAAQGHAVDVVCAWASGLPEKESRTGVMVYRVGGPLLQVLGKVVTRRVVANPLGQSAGQGSGKSVPATGQQTSGFSRAYRLGGRILEKVFWPDYAWTWYLPARREAFRLLRGRDYDGVISVSVPFTSHLVGKCLKRTHPGIRWIVDIGDPFAFFRDVRVNNVFFYERLNFSSEQKVLEKADVITVTTRSTMDEYVGQFPVCSGKVRVIPPLVSIPEDDRGDDTLLGNGEKIRLVFVGTLYRAIRNPSRLLSLFVALLQSELGDRLELHIFGNVNDCGDLFAPYESLMGNKVFVHGMVDRTQAFRAMREADVLVNIGNSTSYQLPSKVVEYASTRKPVLNIVNMGGDSSADFFASYGACLTVIDDGRGIDAGDLTDIVCFIKNPPVVDQETHQHFMCRYMVDEISKEYTKVVLGTGG